jgi:hypothetical protein
MKFVTVVIKVNVLSRFPHLGSEGKDPSRKKINSNFNLLISNKEELKNLYFSRSVVRLV